MDRFAEVYRVLRSAIAEKAFPGCAFGVFADGQVQIEDGLGRFTYEDESAAVMSKTVFDLASVTKVVATTAMAMLLYQRGELALDTPLGVVLPEFLTGRSGSDPAHRVTLRHLLAHSSGLPGYVQFFQIASSPYQLLEACTQLQLEAEPGTRAKYSDPGFILLGRALEEIAGEEISRYVEREILRPLGMSSTLYCPAPEMGATIPPTEEDSSFRHRRIQGEVQDENAWVLGGVAGHAGLFSNVGDLLRFAQSILAAGADTEAMAVNQIFEAVTIEVFSKRQAPAGNSCALGWDTPSEPSSSGRFFSTHSIGHLGYSGCSLWIDLDAAMSAVLLTNRTWPDRQSQLIKVVRPAFHNAVREALQLTI